jgi:DNA polymerase III alpha subunit
LCRCHSKSKKANNVHQLSPYHSLRYGTIPLNELVHQAASCGVLMALTDINTVTGIYDFIKECKAVAINRLLELSFDTTINYFILA